MTRRLTSTALLCTALTSAALLPGPTAASAALLPEPLPAAAAAPAPARPGLLVAWEDDATEAERAAVLARLDLGETSELPLVDGAVVQAAPGRAASALRALAADPAVAAVQPDRVVRRAATPSDPFFGQQWGLSNTGQPVGGRAGAAGVDVQAEAGLAIVGAASATPVVVAVLDGGVDVTHPDLVPHLWSNPAERDGVTGVDDDGNGHVDDVHGVNFRAPAGQSAPLRADVHGTHVAGTIGAVTDNVIGVAGAAPVVELMSLEFLDEQGAGFTSDAIEALDYARRQGARVVNASWTVPGDDPVLRAALAASGMLVVAAAGNDGRDVDAGPGSFPSAYALPNVVSVAAVDSRGGLAASSDFSRTKVGLGAPGVDVLSTVPGGRYGFLTGTSMAAPHVAGVAATALALRPDLPVDRLAGALLSSTTPLPSLSGTTISGGLVSSRRVLAGLAAVACPTSTPSAGFADVPARPGGAATLSVDCVVRYGLAGGFSDGSFRPGAPVSRGQMARFLAALAREAGKVGSGAPSPFTDTSGSPFEADIALLSELSGVVSGTGPGTYSPSASVSRGQMATFLTRLHAVVAGSPLVEAATPFEDTAGTTHAASISRAYEAGLTGGTSPRTYDPARPVRRDQMATFLSREVDALVRLGLVARR